jgi:hypothetical protein
MKAEDAFARDGQSGTQGYLERPAGRQANAIIRNADL